MTTTGRLCVTNEDTHHHEPNEVPAKLTKPTSVVITGALLHGGVASCLLEAVLKWIPTDAGQQVRENDLPNRVFRIDMANDLGNFQMPSPATIELLERWAQMASGAVWKNIFNGMSLDATTLAADTRKFLSVIKCPAQE